MAEQDTASTDKDSWQLIASGSWLAGQHFIIDKHTVLGRDAECDITIPGTHLSRRHAEIAVSGDKLLVRDLGSANGTFVNDKAVNEAELYPGDSIRFDVLTFTVAGPTTAAAMTKKATNKTTRPAQKRPPVANPARKKQQAKPSSVGNRHKTVHMTAVQKTSNALRHSLAIALALASMAALVYLMLQL